MAINNNSASKGSNDSGAQAQQPAQIQQSAPQVQQQLSQQQMTTQQTPMGTNAIPSIDQSAARARSTHGSLVNRRRMGVEQKNTSGLAGEIVKLFDERMKTPLNDGAKYDVLVLQNGQSGLKISAVVIVATPDKTDPLIAGNNNKLNVLAHHTLLLSATASAEPVVVNHKLEWTKNRTAERKLFSYDAYDEQMKTVIKQQLAKLYPGYAQLSAENSEIPRNISAEDKETLMDFIANATRAAGTVLIYEGLPGTVADFSLSDLQQQNGDKALLSVEIDSSFAHIQGINKFPVRGDVVLTVNEAMARSKDGDIPSGYNSMDAQNRLSRIMGFIDLTWVGQQYGMMGGFNPMMGGMMPNVSCYAPQFIVTDVSTETTETLPALFLALASLQSLADGQKWKECLIRQHVEGAHHLVSSSVNMRDIGVIGYEVQQPSMTMDFNAMLAGMNNAAPKAPFPTQGINHDTALLMSLINTYMNASTLPVSIDIAESGTSTWVTSVLLHSALGNEEATNVIRGALDLLTEGAFSVAYANHPNSQGGKAPLIYNNNMFVNLGYWHDDAYGDRDIRDLDYLSHLALTGSTDPEAQHNWLNLHTNTNIDPWIRLEKVTDIQKSIFTNMVVTGRASRVTINPVVLFVLAQCVSQKGYTFDIKDSNAQNQGVQRIVAPWMANMGMNLGTSNAFQARHNTRANGVGFGYGVTNSGRY